MGTVAGLCGAVRATAFVADKYAIVVKNGEQTVGHVPMFLSKLKFFFLRNGGKVSIKVNGQKMYSVELKQGGLELPAELTFRSHNKKLFSQMQEKTLDEVKKFEEKWRMR